jgi:hypothetical protein
LVVANPDDSLSNTMQAGESNKTVCCVVVTADGCDDHRLPMTRGNVFTFHVYHQYANYFKKSA